MDERGDFGPARGNRQRIVEHRVGNGGMALLSRHESLASLCQRGGQLFVNLVVRFFLAREILALFHQRQEPATIRGQHFIEIESRVSHRPRILRAPSARSRLTFQVAANTIERR